MSRCGLDGRQVMDSSRPLEDIVGRWFVFYAVLLDIKLSL